MFFDLDGLISDLWAMAWVSSLPLEVEGKIPTNERLVLWPGDPKGRRWDFQSVVRGRPYMNGQFQHRTPVALAEYRDRRGSGADSKPLAHELSCAKAAIWSPIKPLAIASVLWQLFKLAEQNVALNS